MDHDSVSGESRLPISKAIMAVLDRHGVPERQRLATLKAAVDLSYQQVRRRMSGESPWNVDEIKRLATHFGEPLFGLLATLVDDVGKQATLDVGGTNLHCCIWLGPPAPPRTRIGPLVAVAGESAEHWRAVPISEAGELPAFEIKRLIFEAPAPRRVAIVDADKGLTADISAFLRAKGLDTAVYRSGSALRSALGTTRFDSFILDWTSGGSDAGALLSELRDRYPEAPLVVQVQSGSQDDALATALVANRALLFEKPTGALSLFTALCLGFERQARAS